MGSILCTVKLRLKPFCGRKDYKISIYVQVEQTKKQDKKLGLYIRHGLFKIK